MLPGVLASNRIEPRQLMSSSDHLCQICALSGMPGRNWKAVCQYFNRSGSIEFYGHWQENKIGIS